MTGEKSFIQGMIVPIFWLLCLLYAVTALPAHAAPVTPGEYGVVDRMEYDPHAHTLLVQGHVPTHQTQAPQNLQIRVDKTALTITRQQWSSLDNPGAAPGGPIQGWRVEAVASGALHAGLLPVEMSAVLGNDQHITFQGAQGDVPQIWVKKIPRRHWILLALVLVVIGLAYVPAVACAGQRAGLWVNNHRITVVWLAVAGFVLSVAIGLTGSSFNILRQGEIAQAVMKTAGSSAKLFKWESIRSDEWGVLTPNVLAQLHHTPPFPITNTHIGLAGQNMGVIGMTGVPIKQWAAIARPATWGYFFLPLRQAMSWQWQLPIWGCFLALWLMLNLLQPTMAGRNLALSFAFCIAPYAAAWSNWPLYAALFPVAAFVVAAHILKTSRWLKAAGLGLFLGILLAGWALVLYPPWQIVVGTLCAVIAAGWVIENRRQLRWGAPQAVALVLAGMVMAGLLVSWWHDTRAAVALVQATEYPGARTTLLGGGTAWILWLKGYTNADLVTFGTGPWANSSEASSYFFLPLIMCWLVVWHGIARRPGRWMLWGCAAFMVYYLVFLFLGFPLWLAKYSLWGYVPPYRTDIGVGLALIFLLALIPASKIRSIPYGKNYWIFGLILATLLSIGSGLLIYWDLAKMPPDIFPHNNLVYISAITIVGTIMTWWLLSGRYIAAIIMLVFMHLVSSIGFNPISKAPRKVELATEVRKLVEAPDAPGHLRRTLLISGDGISAMALAAVGIPVVNGVFYYPHTVLWQNLHLSAADWHKANRYQHLGFEFDTHLPPSLTYRVDNKFMDTVTVSIDPRRFDYRSTGAQLVAVPENTVNYAQESPQLHELGSFRGLHWFEVRSKQN